MAIGLASRRPALRLATEESSQSQLVGLQATAKPAIIVMRVMELGRPPMAQERLARLSGFPRSTHPPSSTGLLRGFRTVVSV